MASSHKSFFSTTGGLITGAAGVLSAVVGAAGLAIQQGWVGGDSDGTGQGTANQPGAAGRAGGAGRSGDVDAAVVPTFAVEPDSLSFQPVGPVGSREAKVRVRNTGRVDLELETPTVTGEDADRFKANEGTCTGTVDPGRSCELEVTFSPKAGSFSALLVVDAAGGATAAEVPLKGTSAAL